MLLTEILLFCSTGPVNTQAVNSVPPEIRARALALQVCVIHLFGDAISPVIIGGISDATGSLTYGALLVPVAIILSAVVWGLGIFLEKIPAKQEPLIMREPTEFETEGSVVSEEK